MRSDASIKRVLLSGPKGQVEALVEFRGLKAPAPSTSPVLRFR